MGIEYVDYLPSPRIITPIIPFESRQVVPATISGQIVGFLPPDFRNSDLRRVRGCRYVDLCNDVSTGRAILEAQLPEHVVIPDLLNGAVPPSMPGHAVQPVADGPMGINVRAERNQKIQRICVPTVEEVAEEVFREADYVPVMDEKRSSYLPVIDRFGSLWKAAEAFTGKSRRILEAFIRHGNLTADGLKGYCRLGKGNDVVESYMDRVSRTLQHSQCSDRKQRIGLARFERYSDGETPADGSLLSLLEHWVRRRVLTRLWDLGSCARCTRPVHLTAIDSQAEMLCPTCGSQIDIPPRIRSVYQLPPPVRHAIDEGLAPVVLCGRFLKLLTTQGFMWLPGMKCEKDGQRYDVDLIAVCDGQLVVAECKTLAETSADAGSWTEVTEQFLQTARIGVEIGANLAVLATMAESVPDSVMQAVEAELNGEIAILILNLSDLEGGHKDSTERPGDRLSLSDLIASRLSDEPVQLEGGNRTIDYGRGLQYMQIGTPPETEEVQGD